MPAVEGSCVMRGVIVGRTTELRAGETAEDANVTNESCDAQLDAFVFGAVGWVGSVRHLVLCRMHGMYANISLLEDPNGSVHVREQITMSLAVPGQ